MIRPATPCDNAAIAAIWNREVLETAATTDSEPRRVEAQQAWLAGHGPSYPVTGTSGGPPKRGPHAIGSTHVSRGGFGSFGSFHFSGG